MMTHHRRSSRFSALALLALAQLSGWGVLSCTGAPATKPVGQAQRIDNAVIYDGSGGAPRPGSVRIRSGLIEAVGDLAPVDGENVIDAGGLALAPGFIDTHSHHGEGLADEPEATAAVSQGITTVVIGQDGGSRLPLADAFAALEAAPPAINVASYSGHGTLRERVLGDDFRRRATAAEIAAMSRLLEADLDAGALGLATGLEYDPGIYSSPAEVIELARVAAVAGGRYISHIRSEDRAFWQAIDELIEIGRATGIPVQVSHIKLAMTSLHGDADRLLERLDAARAEGIEVSADIYPYPYWQSTLEVMFPDRDFSDPVAARFAVTELSTPDSMLIPIYSPVPEYAGLTLARISELRGTDPAQTLIDLIALAQAKRAEVTAAGGDASGIESVIATSMTEADIEELMRWPHTNFCTDGALRGAHPRGFGSYPRILGRYVRDHGAMSLAEAVHKSTALAAEHVGIADRGRLVPGLAADLVLFDPETVIDHATTDDPQRVSTGIAKVWVNGELVWSDGAPTGARPGRVLRRPAS